MTGEETEPAELGDLINLLSLMDPDRILPRGITSPHASLGCLHHLAFETTGEMRAGKALKILRRCEGKTFEWHKGGEHTFTKYDPCYVVSPEDDRETYPLTKDYFLQPPVS